ncbi:MAG: hypothetical protein GXP31_07705 [Kiritimatiellaeota bacterium]|nr:hypothetical protein [Kiritimatiellota bacterium]
MANDDFGRCVWFFPDGDLPPPGDGEFEGHESLLILNPNRRAAEVRLTVYFEDRPADRLDPFLVEAERVRCIRMDRPIDGYRVPYGQYALKIESTTPVVCQIGRADVRQPNLAYYTVLGFPG